jgi:hypothetical protein
LQPISQPKRHVKGFEGKLVTINHCFFVPVLDFNEEVQVICAYGVDGIATMAKSRPLEDAGDVFPPALSSLPHMRREGSNCL